MSGRGGTGRGRLRSGTGGLEIELGAGTVEDEGSAVVGSGSVFSGGKGAEPLARALTWLTDLGDPLAPASLPDAAVPKFVVIWATFALAFTSTFFGGGGVIDAVGSVRCWAGSGGCGGDDGGFGFSGLRLERGHWLGPVFNLRGKMETLGYLVQR